MKGLRIMDRYKPSYMGQVMPADNPSKLTDFVVNKYESFSACYDAVKDQSESINSVSQVSTPDGSSEFSMKVDASYSALQQIKEGVKDESVSVKGDVISAK